MANEDGDASGSSSTARSTTSASCARELEARGHRFRDRSGHRGARAPLRGVRPVAASSALDGMFAFALWDAQPRRAARSRATASARSRSTTTTAAGGCLFASELKALLEHPRVPDASSTATRSRATSRSSTCRRRDSILERRAQAARRRIVLVWRAAAASRSSATGTSSSRDAPAREPDERVRRASSARVSAKPVRRRLISDVPLGAFLSRRHRLERGRRVDGRELAARARQDVLDRLRRAELRRVRARARGRRRTSAPTTTRRCFTADVDARRAPDGRRRSRRAVRRRVDPADLPALALRARARDGRARRRRRRRAARRLPDVRRGARRRSATGAARPPRARRSCRSRAGCPSRPTNFSFDFKLKRFLRGRRSTADVRHPVWLGAFTPAEQAALLGRALTRDPVGSEHRGRAARPRRGDRLDALIYLYAKTYLQDDILVKVDRASMAARSRCARRSSTTSSSSSSPACRRASSCGASTTKHLLKRAMRDALPPGIAEPHEEGLRHPGRGLAQDRPARAAARRALAGPARAGRASSTPRGRAPRARAPRRHARPPQAALDAVHVPALASPLARGSSGAGRSAATRGRNARLLSATA